MTNTKETIIVVDNTTSLVSPWKKELANGYNMVEAVGGFEAVSKMKQTPAKAVVVNITLNTYFNGIEVIKRIREKFKAVPIIVIADPSDKLGIKNAAELNTQAIVPIPVNIADIVEKISKFVLPVKEEKKPEQQQAKEPQKNGDENYTKVRDKYYEGQSYLARGDFDNAIKIFLQVSEEKKIKQEVWLKYVEDAQFQLGRCYFSKNDYQKAIDTLTAFVQRAPKSEFVKQALYNIGQSYEALQEKDKAVNFYIKVVQMGGFDPIATLAKKRLRVLQPSNGN